MILAISNSAGKQKKWHQNHILRVRIWGHIVRQDYPVKETMSADSPRVLVEWMRYV